MHPEATAGTAVRAHSSMAIREVVAPSEEEEEKVSQALTSAKGVAAVAEGKLRKRSSRPIKKIKARCFRPSIPRLPSWTSR